MNDFIVKDADKDGNIVVLINDYAHFLTVDEADRLAYCLSSAVQNAQRYTTQIRG